MPRTPPATWVELPWRRAVVICSPWRIGNAVDCPFNWETSVTAPWTMALAGIRRVVNAPSEIRLSRFDWAAMSCFETITVTMFGAAVPLASFRTPWTYRNTAPVAPMASRKATIIAKPLVFMSSPLVVSAERGSTLQDDRFDPELLAVLADGAGLERE